jgi:DNA polymerase/3'-5' exonuclease PolX
MSVSARRIPLEQARSVAAAVIGQWLVPSPADNALPLEQRLMAFADKGVMLAGSIRRQLATAGDIEIVAPLHDSAEDVAQEHRRIDGTLLPDNGGLYPPAGTWAKAVKGFRCSGRYTQFVVYPRLLHKSMFGDVEGTEPDGGVKVDLWRYRPGPFGNKGWIQLIRTGPDDFGPACLARWKRITRGGLSQHGFPHRTATSPPIPVPDEGAAFALLEMPYIEPRDRRGDHPALGGI